MSNAADHTPDPTPSSTSQTGSRHLRRPFLIIAALGLLIAAIICIPTYIRANEQANRRKCYRQFRALGQAMLLYANENKGYFPSRLENLILTQDISGSVFVCPSSHDTPATGNSPEEMAADFAKPGHHSYLRAPAVDRANLESYMQPF